LSLRIEAIDKIITATITAIAGKSKIIYGWRHAARSVSVPPRDRVREVVKSKDWRC